MHLIFGKHIIEKHQNEGWALPNLRVIKINSILFN